MKEFFEYLYKLFRPCEHKWKIIGQEVLIGNGHTYGYIHRLQCAVCGNVKVCKEML